MRRGFAGFWNSTAPRVNCTDGDSMIVLLAIGCSSPQPETIHSKPADPVVTFPSEPQAPPRIVVTVLTQMFERGVVGPPKVLSRLRIGMPRARAVELLKATDGNHDEVEPEPDTPPIVQTSSAGDIELDSVLHVVDPPIRLAIASREEKVVGLNVMLPFEDATLALDDLWGSATPGETGPDGKVTHVWTGQEWTARLVAVPEPHDDLPAPFKGRGILEIAPVTR